MDSLFIEELDGITGATPEEAREAYIWREPEYDPETYDFGPVWSNYGGWVN